MPLAIQTPLRWLPAPSITCPAECVVCVDLSETDVVTIRAGSANYANSRTGSDFTGIFLASWVSEPVDFDGLHNPNEGNEFVPVLNSPDNNGPVLQAEDQGLNLYSMAFGDNLEFTAGTPAFTGTSSYGVNPSVVSILQGGASTGNVYFPADNNGDFASASLIGTWCKIF